MLVMEDTGVYECQANTVPKTQETINLHVKDTVAVIAGPREGFLKAGSQLRLHCIVDLGERQGCSGQVVGGGLGGGGGGGGGGFDGVRRISLINPDPSGPDENFKEKAGLHWFLDKRLLDPAAGRERGLTTHTNIHTRLEVQT